MSAPVTEQPSPGVTEPPNRGVAVPVAVGMVVAAVVAVLVVVGLVVSLTEDRLPTGPALPPPAAMAPEVASTPRQPDRAIRRRSPTRMPGDPYMCPGDARRTPPLLSSGILCSAPVHSDYEGTSDWTATAGFGPWPKDSPARPRRPPPSRSSTRSAPSASTTARPPSPRVTTDQVDLDGHQVALISGNVGYTVPGVPSTYDRVLVIALPLDDGDYAIYFSSRPERHPQDDAGRAERVDRRR